MTTLGIIGGSGLYTLPGAKHLGEHLPETPWGRPASPVIELEVDGVRMLFVSRHGEGHRIAPHEINYRANIAALKILGADCVVSLSAVGSLKEELPPGDLLVVDQYIDWTKRRPSTFFENGAVAHVSMADPVCPLLAESCAQSAEKSIEEKSGVRSPQVHRGGTYICIEGPQFSTRAESHLFRSFGAAVIGMTAMPEAKLAREAELPYCTVAFSTDYDCWHETEEDVGVEAVLAVMRQNVDWARRIVRALPNHLGDLAASPARGALAGAVMTPESHRSEAVTETLEFLLGD